MRTFAMTRTLARVLLLGSLILGACGGQTAMEVIVETDSGIVVGRDFDAIRVSIRNIDRQSYSETYAVDDQTEKPYRVYVLAGYEKKSAIDMTVELLKSGVKVYEDTRLLLKFEPGEIGTVTFRFERKLGTP